MTPKILPLRAKEIIGKVIVFDTDVAQNVVCAVIISILTKSVYRDLRKGQDIDTKPQTADPNRFLCLSGYKVVV